MTILAIAVECCERLGLGTPAALVAATDNNLILLRAMMLDAVEDIRNQYEWEELQTEYTFTLATDTANYALPADFHRLLTETWWNRTQGAVLWGPTDAIDWQLYKSGLATTVAGQRFRIKGFADNQFYLDSTPTSGENGQTVAYEYISTRAIRPKTWVASTSWNGIQYCFYNGNYYDRGATTNVSTGTTAPTHTSGAVSDGSITWTFFTSALAVTKYQTFVHDSDEIELDNKMIRDSAVWRYLERRGRAYQEKKTMNIEDIELAKSRRDPSAIIDYTGGIEGVSMIGMWNYPESGY